MKFIIGSLVGAIIGYITNWLAIKMLFRPHKEIRIGNFKVPFTPGLIPKEKSRIAKSVGETIGKHLLTQETIINSLCSETMNEQLDSWVQNKVSSIAQSDSTVESELKDLLGNEYSNLLQHANFKVSKSLINFISEDSVKQSIANYINEKIILELSASPQFISESGLYISLKSKLLNMALEYKDSESFSIEMHKLLEEKIYSLKDSNKTFQEIMPEGILSNLKVYTYGKRYDIAMAIKTLLHEEKNRWKLRGILDKTLAANLNPMISMFIKVDSIFEKVVIGLDNYLDDDNNHNDIALIVNDIIDKLLSNSISSVISELPKEGIDASIKSLINLVTGKIIDERFIHETLHKLESKLNEFESIEGFLESSGVDYKASIEIFLKKHIDSISESDATKTKIEEVVSILINKLLNVEMKSIFNEDKDKISQSISIIVKDLYNKFIENKAADVIEVLDVSKIVEDEINKFEVSFAEEIILGIASKELSAITWLGALLGAIMGLLSPIISSF